MNKIDKLIINSPYKEPQRYWSYKRETREFLKKRSKTGGLCDYFGNLFGMDEYIF